MARLKMDIELALGEFRLAVTQSLELEGSTALFGPSGSGKTSLLRIIAGLETQARGRMVSGQDTWQDSKTGAWVPPHRRELGMVFQDARLFTHLSVAGNLRYADRRARSTEIDIGFSEVVAAMDLGPLLDRKVDGLSGGERQRVAIGRTLLRRPRLLLMDEPLAALDRQRKAELIPYIEALPARFGIPILYVTHALEEVGRLADRMLVMSEGRVLTTGRTAEVMESKGEAPWAEYSQHTLSPGARCRRATGYRVCRGPAGSGWRASSRAHYPGIGVRARPEAGRRALCSGQKHCGRPEPVQRRNLTHPANRPE
jgi:molybdate transport system ATP-binding protein